MGYQFLKVYHGTWMKGHFKLLFIGILGVLLLAVFSSACSEKSGKPVPASIPVIVSTVTQKAVPVQIRAIGNVQACSTVTVKAKVGGELTRVHFTEGPIGSSQRGGQTGQGPWASLVKPLGTAPISNDLFQHQTRRFPWRRCCSGRKGSKGHDAWNHQYCFSRDGPDVPNLHERNRHPINHGDRCYLYRSWNSV